MAYSSFHIGSYSQEVEINNQSIRGDLRYGQPSLSFQCNLKLHWSDNRNYSGFEIINYKAKLIVGNNQVFCGETFGQLSIKVRENETSGVGIDFFISNETIHRIEKIRNTDLKLTLDITFQVAKFHDIELKKDNYNSMVAMVTSFDYSSCRVETIIAQSMWVSEILPKLGYNETRLIEISNYNNLLGDAYEYSVSEMIAANDYFIKGDYDKTVAHCRAAVEAIKKKLDVFKEHLESKSELDWVKTVYESTNTWLVNMTKATFALSSKSHHYPSLGHFSREQAEIIKVITLGIVAFAGRISQSEKNS